MLAIFLFSLGTAAFAMASTSGQPETYMWFIGAVALLSSAAITGFEYIKEDVQ